jgi:predicted thioesterase
VKNIFQPGDKKKFSRTVRQEDAAMFETGAVHPVYSTFSLVRDAEWCCRLFVLEMKEDDEEGIGVFVSVHHESPAMVGETVDFEAVLESVAGNEVICSFSAFAGARKIARGRQGQKILKKKKIDALFESFKNG